jgi:hypothetical protein
LPPASSAGLAAFAALRRDDLASALRLASFAATRLAPTFFAAFVDFLRFLPAIAVHSICHSIDGETTRDRVGANGQHGATPAVMVVNAELAPAGRRRA